MTFNVIFEIADEPRSVAIRCEAPSSDDLIQTVCDWIESGLVPLEMPNGDAWLLPASAIEGFDIKLVEDAPA